MKQKIKLLRFFAAIILVASSLFGSGNKPTSNIDLSLYPQNNEQFEKKFMEDFGRPWLKNVYDAAINKDEGAMRLMIMYFDSADGAIAEVMSENATGLIDSDIDFVYKIAKDMDKPYIFKLAGYAGYIYENGRYTGYTDGYVSMKKYLMSKGKGDVFAEDILTELISTEKELDLLKE